MLDAGGSLSGRQEVRQRPLPCCRVWPFPQALCPRIIQHPLDPRPELVRRLLLCCPNWPQGICDVRRCDRGNGLHAQVRLRIARKAGLPISPPFSAKLPAWALRYAATHSEKVALPVGVPGSRPSRSAALSLMTSARAAASDFNSTGPRLRHLALRCREQQKVHNLDAPLIRTYNDRETQ